MAGRGGLGARLRAGSVADFLAFWLEECPLDGAEQAAFEHYYRSYRRHFGPYLRHWYARQTEELMRLIRSGEARTLLEVGAGCGTEALWAALHGASVKGIDISRELLAAAERRQRLLEAAIGEKLDCRFEYRSLLAMDEAQFDAVYLEQALHHLEPRASVIGRLAALVRPGGRLVISETNGWNPLVQLQLFHRRGFRTISTHEGHAWGHERITVPAALLRQFARHGFEKESLAYYRTLPNIAAADRMLRLERLVPGFAKPFFTHYNLVLRKG
ncbi:MAG: class I SAM-dependent methyltransferase [Rhodospirillales bacterium]|nr:class I SAM-dependent methyltransferase [Rhodospirillales bacterium]